MSLDILDLDSKKSITRKLWNEKTVIDLSDYDIPCYILPSDYSVKELHLPKENYDQDILAGIQKLLRLAKEGGFDKERLHSPVFEGCRNAHQHGNYCDSQKKIIIGYSIIPNKSLDIVIIDEGGKLNPNFFPFLQRHRQGLHIANYKSFYDFCEIEKPGPNHGIGTTLIHTPYLNEIHYYKSENNGLALHLLKRK
jgi:anti-sigma regulatory factor (Ser/Thr protein kinase)